MLCVYNMFLHLLNPDLSLSNRGWWGWDGFVWSQFSCIVLGKRLSFPCYVVVSCIMLCYVVLYGVVAFDKWNMLSLDLGGWNLTYDISQFILSLLLLLLVVVVVVVYMHIYIYIYI